MQEIPERVGKTSLSGARCSGGTDMESEEDMIGLRLYGSVSSVSNVSGVSGVSNCGLG